jgi:hypothetical protein
VLIEKKETVLRCVASSVTTPIASLLLPNMRYVTTLAVSALACNEDFLR